jgi:hypothetical protein
MSQMGLKPTSPDNQTLVRSGLESGHFCAGRRAIGEPPTFADQLKNVDIAAAVVASPEYLAGRGVPQDVSELRNHDLIAFDNFTRNREWRFGPVNQSEKFDYVPAK